MNVQFLDEIGERDQFVNDPVALEHGGAMPKRSGPNHHRFAVRMYLLSGRLIVVTGCKASTKVADLVDMVATHLNHDYFDIHLIFGLQQLLPSLTFRQAKIRKATVLSIMITEDVPPPLIDTSN